MADRFLLRSVVAIVAITALSALVKGYAASVLTWIAIAAVLASSLRFVMLIGELNFALAAFVGLGAYAAGVAATIWEIPFFLALLVAGGVALAVSVVFGYVTLRVKGPYFLLIGFAFTEVLRILYTRSTWLGGNSGLVGVFPPTLLGSHFASFVIGLAALMIVGMLLVERSHLGRLFVAVRDNENVVRSVGMPVHWIKVLCFSIASLVAGIAGALHAYSNNVISPPDFGFMLSTFVLAYLKVGGEDHPLGPVAGAVLLVFVGSWAKGYGGAEHILYGAAIVIAVLFLPGGLMALVARVCGALRRRAGPRLEQTP